jgi:1-acyl-sn-glycerol-3-phosphate acyltransferase
VNPEYNPKEIRKVQNIYYILPIIFQSVIYGVTLVIFKIFCRIQFSGLENLRGLDTSRGVIFAANHSSEWDGILTRIGLPFLWQCSPMYYVAMEKKFYTDSGWRKILYGGHLFNMLGAYPVYSGHRDYAFSLQNHIAIVKGGRSLCIFPEGVRTKDGNIGIVHGGVAYLTHATHAPVVPVAISGLVNLRPIDFFLFRRKVVLHFGTPIEHLTTVPQIHPTVANYKSGATFVMQKVAELLSHDK